MTTYCPRCLSISPCHIGHNPAICTPHPAAEELERLRTSLTAAERAYDDMVKIADDLQRELACTCNAEEMRQVRAENKRLRDALVHSKSSLSQIAEEAVKVLVETPKGDEPMMMAPWVAGTANAALSIIRKALEGK